MIVLYSVKGVTVKYYYPLNKVNFMLKYEFPNQTRNKNLVYGLVLPCAIGTIFPKAMIGFKPENWPSETSRKNTGIATVTSIRKYGTRNVAPPCL